MSGRHAGRIQSWRPKSIDWSSLRMAKSLLNSAPFLNPGCITSSWTPTLILGHSPSSVQSRSPSVTASLLGSRRLLSSKQCAAERTCRLLMTVPPHQGRLDRPRVVIPACQGTGAESQSWPTGQMIFPSFRGTDDHRLLADSGMTPH